MNAVKFLREQGLHAHVVQCIEGMDLSTVQRQRCMRALECSDVRRIRDQRRLGWYRPRANAIGISSLAMSPDQFRDTILHEVAHLIEHATRGSLAAAMESHGAQWQRIAVSLGCTPEAKASDPLFAQSARERREALSRVVARCTSCGHEIVRMRRSKRDWSCYVHSGCGGRMESAGGAS